VATGPVGAPVLVVAVAVARWQDSRSRTTNDHSIYGSIKIPVKSEIIFQIYLKDDLMFFVHLCLCKLFFMLKNILIYYKTIHLAYSSGIISTLKDSNTYIL
jgi:hypothetical protein